MKHLTSVLMLPMVAAPTHEWNTMLTILKQAQKITSVVMGEGYKTVITFDLQLYEKAVKLQLHTAPAHLSDWGNAYSDCISQSTWCIS